MKKIISQLILIYLFIIPISLISAETVLKIGKSDAKVTIKVFSSLTCPHCAKFHENIFSRLKSEYIDAGKVTFEHHSFPLDLAALNAEKLIRCSSSVEKNFDLLAKLYEKQKDWAIGSDINVINKLLIKIGLENNFEERAMNKRITDEKIQEIILNERIDAQKKYKISSTPTIYINDKKYEGGPKYKSLKKQIDKLL